MFQITQAKLIANSKNPPNLETFNNYIITEPNFNTLASTIKILKNKINTRGHFLVLLRNRRTNDELIKIFEEYMIKNNIGLAMITKDSTGPPLKFLESSSFFFFRNLMFSLYYLQELE